jgi:glycerol uptake facilitator-like aquaporin
MAYAISHILGCRLNPIISIRLRVGIQLKSLGFSNYLFSYVLGAILAAGTL